jgi:hypothetical protein
MERMQRQGQENGEDAESGLGGEGRLRVARGFAAWACTRCPSLPPSPPPSLSPSLPLSLPLSLHHFRSDVGERDPFRACRAATTHTSPSRPSGSICSPPWPRSAPRRAPLSPCGPPAAAASRAAGGPASEARGDAGPGAGHGCVPGVHRHLPGPVRRGRRSAAAPRKPPRRERDGRPPRRYCAQKLLRRRLRQYGRAVRAAPRPGGLRDLRAVRPRPARPRPRHFERASVVVTGPPHFRIRAMAGRARLGEGGRGGGGLSSHGASVAGAERPSPL